MPERTQTARALRRRAPGLILITAAALYSVVPLLSMVSAALAPQGTFPSD
ncbi:hypothetical protein STAFG_4743 [Streptomyces afghaniensis 772]|uniref:Uncharacterized protein n=1 Tax=Streptomyces afghaniensis 772 TaxID=1283301 RepID=S4MFG3_9ACTN|nr:hypothetical protein [Streptomyces afghaniensis]EPJ38228.1 hypothetical protein STAFG_4743 [Streptomyces afghaniensis 772]